MVAVFPFLEIYSSDLGERNGSPTMLLCLSNKMRLLCRLHYKCSPVVARGHILIDTAYKANVLWYTKMAAQTLVYRNATET